MNKKMIMVAVIACIGITAFGHHHSGFWGGFTGGLIGGLLGPRTYVAPAPVVVSTPVVSTPTYVAPTTVVAPTPVVTTTTTIPAYSYGYYNNVYCPTYSGYYYYNNAWVWGRPGWHGHRPPPPMWRPHHHGGFHHGGPHHHHR